MTTTTTRDFVLTASTDASVEVDSAPLLAQQLVGFATQSVFTGSPVGTLYLQASNDAGVITSDGEQAATGIANWATVATLAVSGAGSYDINCSGQFFRWARVVYIPVSGASTIVTTVASRLLP